MITASLKNKQNQTVNLNGQPGKFQLFKITGLDPGNAVINSTAIAGMDGTRFNSARLNNRQIVIYLKLEGDPEAARRELYSKFPNKAEVTLTVTTFTTASITGHVSGISCGTFDQKEILQMSILCDDPYFYGPATETGGTWNTESKEIIVVNNGDAGAGFILQVAYDGQVGGTEFTLSTGTGFMQFDFPAECETGQFTIDTINETFTINEISVPGLIDGVPLLKFGSTFPKLGAGENTIIFTNQQADFVARFEVPTKIGGM